MSWVYSHYTYLQSFKVWGSTLDNVYKRQILSKGDPRAVSVRVEPLKIRIQEIQH